MRRGFITILKKVKVSSLRWIYTRIDGRNLLGSYGTRVRTRKEIPNYQIKALTLKITFLDGSLNGGFIHIGKVNGDLVNCFNSVETWKVNKAGKRYKTLQVRELANSMLTSSLH